MKRSTRLLRAMGPYALTAIALAVGCAASRTTPPAPPLPPALSSASPAGTDSAPSPIEADPIPAPPVATDTDLDVVAPEGPEPNWPAALVWRWDGLPETTTFWVEPSPDGSVREVRRRREPVVVTSRGLVAVRERAVPIAVCEGCQQCGSSDRRGCKEVLRTDRWWELFDLGMKKGVPLAGWPKRQPALEGCKTSLELRETHASISAVGTIVTVSTGSATIRCGSLEWSDAAKTVDVETGAEQLLPLPSQDVDSLKKRAAEALVETDRNGCNVDPNDPPQRFASRFSYNALGRLLGTYVMRMRTDPPCRTGPSPYNSETDVVDLALPAAVTPWRRLPSWLVVYVNEHRITSVSPIAVGRNLGALKKLFESPMPPSPPP